MSSKPSACILNTTEWVKAMDRYRGDHPHDPAAWNPLRVHDDEHRILLKHREKRLGQLRIECEALRLVVVGMAQRLWQCDFATEMDAIELLYLAEKEEEAMYEPALVAACEVLLESAKTKTVDEVAE